MGKNKKDKAFSIKRRTSPPLLQGTFFSILEIRKKWLKAVFWKHLLFWTKILMEYALLIVFHLFAPSLYQYILHVYHSFYNEAWIDTQTRLT